MSNFSETVKSLVPYFDDLERRHDAVLLLSRHIVRLCAKAIKEIHTEEKDALLGTLGEIEAKINEMKAVDQGFENISEHCYQEYAEIKCFLAISEQAEIPSHADLAIPPAAYLCGVADCVGELKRALQIALKDGEGQKAEYFFQRMSDIYDNIMVVKYSSALVGPLKQKQDMVRSSLDHARTELLMARIVQKG
jgi:translin